MADDGALAFVAAAALGDEDGGTLPLEAGFEAGAAAVDEGSGLEMATVLPEAVSITTVLSPPY